MVSVWCRYDIKLDVLSWVNGCFWLLVIGLMLMSVTLALTMICFQSFFALFIRAFARNFLSMNEYGIFKKKKKILATILNWFEDIFSMLV